VSEKKKQEMRLEKFSQSQVSVSNLKPDTRNLKPIGEVFS
jgi:hypothetical protein